MQHKWTYRPQLNQPVEWMKCGLIPCHNWSRTLVGSTHFGKLKFKTRQRSLLKAPLTLLPIFSYQTRYFVFGKSKPELFSFSLSLHFSYFPIRAGTFRASRERSTGERRTETNNPIISAITALMSWFQSVRDDLTLRPFELQHTQWVSVTSLGRLVGLPGNVTFDCWSIVSACGPLLFVSAFSARVVMEPDCDDSEHFSEVPSDFVKVLFTASVRSPAADFVKMLALY